MSGYRCQAVKDDSQCVHTEGHIGPHVAVGVKPWMVGVHAPEPYSHAGFDPQSGATFESTPVAPDQGLLREILAVLREIRDRVAPPMASSPTDREDAEPKYYTCQQCGGKGLIAPSDKPLPWVRCPVCDGLGVV